MDRSGNCQSVIRSETEKKKLVLKLTRQSEEQPVKNLVSSSAFLYLDSGWSRGLRKGKGGVYSRLRVEVFTQSRGCRDVKGQGECELVEGLEEEKKK